MKIVHVIHNKNKSAQSSLGRGPRRGAVGHVRRKVPIGYNGAPQICLKKYPFPWTDPQNPTTCLIPGPVRPTIPNGCRIRSAFFLRCAGQANRPTDRPREGLTTIGRCAPRATRPNNKNTTKSCATPYKLASVIAKFQLKPLTCKTPRLKRINCSSIADNARLLIVG